MPITTEDIAGYCLQAILHTAIFNDPTRNDDQSHRVFSGEQISFLPVDLRTEQNRDTKMLEYFDHYDLTLDVFHLIKDQI